MSNEEYYTTTAYAELHNLKVQLVRYHCAKGQLDCMRIQSSGHGTFLIPAGAEITRAKRGRKVGWNKKKKD